MKLRKLGKSNLEVSAIGLGCIGMSYAYGQIPDKKRMISLIHSALDKITVVGDRYPEELEKRTGR